MDDGKLRRLSSAKDPKLQDKANDIRDLVDPGLIIGYRGHGTFVTLLALSSGSGKVLGTGRHAEGYLFRATRRPDSSDEPKFTLADIRNAFMTAVSNPRVNVINMSFGVSADGEEPDCRQTNRLDCLEKQFGELFAEAEKKGVVYVNSAGNLNVKSGEGERPLPKRLAPIRCTRGAAANPRKLFVVVGATDIPGTASASQLGGPETRWYSSPNSGSNYGPLVHLSAPGGKHLVRTRPIGTTDSGSGGTSWAAPIVSGLLAEMIELSEAVEGVPPTDAARSAHQLRLIETLEATADDLGSLTDLSQTNPLRNKDIPNPNDDAGNGPDDTFGHGRVNAWKAFLSVANGGIATQHGRSDLHGATEQDPPDGFADAFPQVALKDDGATSWYGFEISTSVPGVSVWINGVKLVNLATLGADGMPDLPNDTTPDDTMPFAPEIRAYQGVRSDTRIERGIHVAGDGFSGDNVSGTRPGLVVEEDPLTGILPVGTEGSRTRATCTAVLDSTSGSARFVQPGPAVSDSDPPQREPAAHGAHAPYFSLRLDTAKLRTGEVSGVTFDDFVFVITPTDYGDAYAGPTLLSANGARHNEHAARMARSPRRDPAILRHAGAQRGFGRHTRRGRVGQRGWCGQPRGTGRQPRRT